MKINATKISFFAIIIFSLFFYACRKVQPKCQGNCVDVIISGSATLEPGGSALANIPVEVNWFKKQYCIGCTSYKIASGKTDVQGKFSFKTSVDSTFFKDYFLSVRVPADTNFITLANEGGVLFNEKRFNNFQSGDFTNLQFQSYTKALLTISLHRTLTDNFTTFSIEHSFVPGVDYVDYILSGSEYAKDTSFIVATAPDLFTTISWQKNGPGNVQQKDSLKCTVNGTNIFDINY